MTKAAPPTAYFPMVMNDFWDSPLYVQRWMSYAIRTPRVRTAGFLAEVQQAVWGVNPNLPLARPRTMQAIYDESMASTSFALVIIGIAAVVTLLLGFVGLYGVIAYIVSQRTREVGIRMAIGASGHQVQSMFLRRGLTLTGIGVARRRRRGRRRHAAALGVALRGEPVRPAHLWRGDRRAGQRGAPGDVAAGAAGDASGSVRRAAI